MAGQSSLACAHTPCRGCAWSSAQASSPPSRRRSSPRPPRPPSAPRTWSTDSSQVWRDGMASSIWRSPATAIRRPCLRCSPHRRRRRPGLPSSPVFPFAVEVADFLLPGRETFAALALNVVLGAAAVLLIGVFAARLRGLRASRRAMVLVAIFPGSFVLSFAYSRGALPLPRGRVPHPAPRPAVATRWSGGCRGVGDTAERPGTGCGGGGRRHRRRAFAATSAARSRRAAGTARIRDLRPGGRLACRGSSAPGSGCSARSGMKASASAGRR